MIEFDNSRAFREGWGVFNGSELQRLDDPENLFPEVKEPRFQSDAEALGYVWRRAGAGSVYHRQALSTMAANSRGAA